MSKYKEAEPLYMRSLIIFEQQLGDEHLTTQSVRAVRENLEQLLSIVTTEEQTWIAIIN